MTTVQRSPIVEKILGCAIAVHKALGPGLLESSYDKCFSYECTMRGIRFRQQVPVPVLYREVQIDCGYRLDYVIEDSVLLEIKSVDRLIPLHHAQVITYLKLTGYPRGLLINFNVKWLMDGVRSVLLDQPVPGVEEADKRTPDEARGDNDSSLVD